jgi:mono/diheme cytochrome c family protein
VTGAGDGLVTKRGMPGFPINAGAPTGFPDGKIFHLTSYGRNNMPSYATQVSQEDRWKIVLHLRELQKAAQTAAGQPQ